MADSPNTTALRKFETLGNVVTLAAARVLRSKKQQAHEADDLSFMERKVPAGTGINYWKVQGTGNYTADCERGHQLAREYLAYIGKHPTNGNATLLGCIVNGIIQRVHVNGRLSGIEIGFLAEVNGYAMAFAATIDEARAGWRSRPWTAR